MEKRCYSVKELQEILDISRQCVYELLKRKEFRWVLIGGKYRISKASFDEWLDKGFEPEIKEVLAEESVLSSDENRSQSTS